MPVSGKELIFAGNLNDARTAKRKNDNHKNAMLNMELSGKQSTQKPATGFSKSIVVNQNRNNRTVLQSLGRYNDVMSQENLELEYQIMDSDGKEVKHERIGELP